VIYGVLSTIVWILLVWSSVLGYHAHHQVDDLPTPDTESDGQRAGGNTDSIPLQVIQPPNAAAGEYSALNTDEPANVATESDRQRTPIDGGSFAIPLQDTLPQNAATEDYSALNIDEPANVTTESNRQLLTPIVGGSIVIPLQGAQPPDTAAEESILLYTDETASHGVGIADWLRWIGKSLAIINAIGIIANSVFQYSGLYDNCYCDASVFTWGTSYAFDVIAPIQSDFDLARKAWIGALALALISCTFFVGTIYLIRDSFPS